MTTPIDTTPAFAIEQPVACTRVHQYICRTSAPITYLMRVIALPEETSQKCYIVATPQGLLFAAGPEELRDLADEELEVLRDYEAIAQKGKKFLYGGVGGRISVMAALKRPTELVNYLS